MKEKKSQKPTSIDFVILGLIQGHPHSGYQIRKVFETTALGSHSKSPGTIYPALNRLQKLDFVEKIEQNKIGKAKYQITQKGINILQKWLIKPIERLEVEGKRDELFLRFAFMEPLIDKKQIINFLKSYHELLIIYIDNRIEYSKKDEHSMSQTARLVFEHGTESHKSTLKWCENAIKEIKK